MHKNKMLLGLLLLLGGTALLIGQFVSMPSGLVLVFAAAALIVLRLTRGGYGYTIAGALCAAVGAGWILGLMARVLGGARLWFRIEDGVQMLLLGAAFCSIYVFERRRVGWWPLLPGVALLVMAVVELSARFLAWFPDLWTLARRWWPLALICVGAALLIGALRGHGREPQRDQAQEGKP